MKFDRHTEEHLKHGDHIKNKNKESSQTANKEPKVKMDIPSSPACLNTVIASSHSRHGPSATFYDNHFLFFFIIFRMCLHTQAINSVWAAVELYINGRLCIASLLYNIPLYKSLLLMDIWVASQFFSFANHAAMNRLTVTRFSHARNPLD